MGITRSNIPGNAGTATKLQTARNINGVAFDGSTNITLPGITTAQVNAVQAGSEVGAVGTYAMLYGKTELTIEPGGTTAGSNLEYGPSGGASPTGTWRLMGKLSTSAFLSLWLRVS